MLKKIKTVSHHLLVQLLYPPEHRKTCTYKADDHVCFLLTIIFYTPGSKDRLV